MAVLPAESLPYVSHLGRIVFRLDRCPTRDAKALRTLRSRRLHFLKFLHDHRLAPDQDFLLESRTHEGRNLVFAIYAVYLAEGETLVHRTIKVSTIVCYLLAAASLCRLSPSNPHDPRHSPATDKNAPILKKVLDECKRTEVIPDKQEPFTLEQLKLIIELGRKSPSDSLAAAIADWSEINIFSGNRLSEWAHPNAFQEPESPQQDVFGTRAFTLRDVECLTAAKTPLSHAQVLMGPDAQVEYVRLRYSTQKNGSNGEIRLYSRNPAGGYSLVQPMVHVLRRFCRLRGLDDTKTPLSIYRDSSTRKILLIRATNVEAAMQRAACEAFGLHPKRDADKLSKWTSHSYRIGACCILFAMGYPIDHIQWLLRWKGDSWKEYLRNLTIIAREHTRTLDKAAAMPHLI